MTKEVSDSNSTMLLIFWKTSISVVSYTLLCHDKIMFKNWIIYEAVYIPYTGS